MIADHRQLLRSTTQAPRRRLRALALSLLLWLLAGCSAAPQIVEIAPTVAATPESTATSAPIASATPHTTATPESTATPAATATPEAIAPTATPLAPLPTPVLPALDRQGRDDLFEQVWTTINDHYLYGDFGGVDWSAIREQYRTQALDADTPAHFYAALADMVEQLRDRHSRFENPQEAFEQQAIADGTDAYVGVGLLSEEVPEGLLVTTVFSDSPAADMGIQRRDIIERVDGQPIAAGDHGIRGEAGTSVRLTVRSPDGVVRDVLLQRRAVLARYVPQAYRLPGTNIGYLLIQTFWAQDTAEQTRAALDTLLRDGAPDGLIIDLRGNGGGWRSVLEGLLANFVSGEVGSWWSQDKSYPLTIEASPLYDRLRDVPIAVLIDDQTESYAEVFAAVMQSSRQATVIGVASAGNTETIFAYDFDDGSRLWVAQEGFKLPGGVNLEGRGVQPDQAIDVDWLRYSEARDPQIVAALAQIQQRAGSN